VDPAVKGVDSRNQSLMGAIKVRAAISRILGNDDKGDPSKELKVGRVLFGCHRTVSRRPARMPCSKCIRTQLRRLGLLGEC
jgi:hypothetical protein